MRSASEGESSGAPASPEVSPTAGPADGSLARSGGAQVSGATLHSALRTYDITMTSVSKC